MVSLSDIAEFKQSVKLGGQSIEVVGMSAEGFAVILQRFPEVKMMFAGKTQDITGERLLTLVPAAIKSIIAAGIGKPGDEQAEAAAAKLPIGYQMDIIDAIIKASLPGGVGPFVEKVYQFIPSGLIERANEKLGEVADTK